MPRPAWLAVGAAVGALALEVTPSPLVLILFAGSILAVAFAFQASGRPGTATRAAALALGIVALAIRGATAPPPAPVGGAPAGDGPWIGVVQSVSAPRAGARPAVVLLETEPETVVAATLPWYPPVVPGDRIELRGRIRPPPPDEYGAYLARIGAVGTLRADSLTLSPGDGSESSLGGNLEALRRGASDGLSHAMPEPEAGLAAGVLIGLRDRVDRDLAADFTTAGASHVVAISGWNIAIVASTLAAVAGGLRRRRRAILTAAAIVLYVAFVGPSPSVVRAGVMAGVALLAREVGRPGTAAGALGWAVTALLVLDPAYIDDAGFRLSVLATAGILAWGSSLTARLGGSAPSRPRRWLAEILGVSLAAQAATTPIVLLDFGRLSLVAPLVNLIVVPLVPPAMATGALALGVGALVGFGLPGVVATLLGLPAWVLYAAMVATVRAGASLPMASLQLEPPWELVGAALAACAIAAFARWGPALLLRLTERRRSSNAPRFKPRRQPGRRGISQGMRAGAAAIAGATIALALAIAHRPDGVVRVVVMDVGQGDGILVEGGRGGRLVIDGGPDPGRLLIALDERLPPWDRRIDLLVLTHPHEDHVAGLAALLSRYRVGRVYEPGMVGLGPGYQAWTAALAGGGPPRGRLATGDRLRLDDIQFRVLWPDPEQVPERPPDGGTGINNVSIVLLGEFDGHRVLLAGDIEEQIDPQLLRRGLPQVDLLKVAHHGSRTSSTPAFLDAVRPRVAVVSAGLGNPYGHPAPATIDRLHAIARETYRTDTDGTVEVSFDGPSIRVRTTGPRREADQAPHAAAASAPAAVAASALTAASAPANVATAFLCGIPGPGNGLAVAPAPWRASMREAPPPARAIVGRVDARSAGVDDLVRLPRLPEPVIGAALALGYHRADADVPGAGDCAALRYGSSRLLLGRRRLWPRRGRRRLPSGSWTVPGRPSRALAPGDRAQRTRPPPR